MKRGIDMFKTFYSKLNFAKKFLLVMMLAIIMSVANNMNEVHASPQSDLLGKYVDMRLSLDVGINRADYQRLYRELYIATKKSESQMSPEEYAKFDDVLKIYADLSAIWGSSDQYFYEKDIKEMFGDKYPDVSQEVWHDVWGKYEKMSIVQFIINKTDEPAKTLEKYFADKAKT